MRMHACTSAAAAPRRLAPRMGSHVACSQQVRLHASDMWEQALVSGSGYPDDATCLGLGCKEASQPGCKAAHLILPEPETAQGCARAGHAVPDAVYGVRASVVACAAVVGVALRQRRRRRQGCAQAASGRGGAGPGRAGGRQQGTLLDSSGGQVGVKADAVPLQRLRTLGCTPRGCRGGRWGWLALPCAPLTLKRHTHTSTHTHTPTCRHARTRTHAAGSPPAANQPPPPPTGAGRYSARQRTAGSNKRQATGCPEECGLCRHRPRCTTVAGHSGTPPWQAGRQAQVKWKHTHTCARQRRT